MCMSTVLLYSLSGWVVILYFKHFLNCCNLEIINEAKQKGGLLFFWVVYFRISLTVTFMLLLMSHLAENCRISEIMASRSNATGKQESVVSWHYFVSLYFVHFMPWISSSNIYHVYYKNYLINWTLVRYTVNDIHVLSCILAKMVSHFLEWYIIS